MVVILRITMGAEWREYLEPFGPGRMRIKKHGKMLTDAFMVANEKHIQEHKDDRSPNQIINTASMFGIVGNAWAMADWHFGYGFPIGGVVATDTEAGEQGGSISPGGVGFDINCGVRLCSLDITISDINIKQIASELALRIPAGATRKGGLNLDRTQLDSILSGGARTAVELGWGESRDLMSIESNGILESKERNLSDRAMKRGEKALGTLGSGNHFLELQVVDKIVDKEAAQSYGLSEGQITVMIHTGSRGLGHQVCSEHVNAIESNYKKNNGIWHSPKWGIEVTDRQLAAAPIHSREGQEYLDSMNAAGNYAFANRSALTQKIEKCT